MSISFNYDKLASLIEQACKPGLNVKCDAFGLKVIREGIGQANLTKKGKNTAELVLYVFNTTTGLYDRTSIVTIDTTSKTEVAMALSTIHSVLESEPESSEPHGFCEATSFNVVRVGDSVFTKKKNVICAWLFSKLVSLSDKGIVKDFMGDDIWFEFTGQHDTGETEKIIYKPGVGWHMIDSGRVMITSLELTQQDKLMLDSLCAEYADMVFE